MRDFEIIVADPGGDLDFQALMQRFMSKNQLVDVIYKDSQSIASKPLTVRKTVLNSL